LTVHRDSVWIKKNQLDVTFVLFISLLIVAQHVSGNHVPISRSWRLRDVIASCWYMPWLRTHPWTLPASRSWQPSCSHGTYQHQAITSRSRQLLMMGTWLPETCWAASRRERIQKWHLVGFSYPHWYWTLREQGICLLQITSFWIITSFWLTYIDRRFGVAQHINFSTSSGRVWI